MEFQLVSAHKSALRHHSRRVYHEHKRSFSRATLTSLAATVVDFGSLYLLVERGHVYYVLATAMAAVFGAITNFTLNKYWAFEHHHGRVTTQGFKYALVSGVSLILNTGLVFCFTEFGQLRYLVSKAISAVAVGWGWNYPMHRYFVFSKSPSQSRVSQSKV